MLGWKHYYLFKTEEDGIDAKPGTEEAIEHVIDDQMVDNMECGEANDENAVGGEVPTEDDDADCVEEPTDVDDAVGGGVATDDEDAVGGGVATYDDDAVVGGVATDDDDVVGGGVTSLNHDESEIAAANQRNYQAQSRNEILSFHTKRLNFRPLVSGQFRVMGGSKGIDEVPFSEFIHLPQFD